MPHHPCASPASPASPATKTWGAASGAPLCDQACQIRGAESGIRTGVVLTLIPGFWRGATPITLTYQWTRDGTNIAGATTASYTCVAADSPGHVIRCVETATNAQGNASQASLSSAQS